MLSKLPDELAHNNKSNQSEWTNDCRYDDCCRKVYKKKPSSPSSLLSTLHDTSLWLKTYLTR